jgi:SOS-response transcriptional repressor LexA
MLSNASVMSHSYKMYEENAIANRTPCTTVSGHNVRMEQPKDRLRQAREEFGLASPAEASRAFPRDINQHTLTSHENGNRELSKKAAAKYAKLFKRDAGWLLYGREEQPADQTILVPVLSRVSAGNLRHQQGITANDIERHIKIADLHNGIWYALEVEGDSMDRVAQDGATILFNQSEDKLLDGKYYIFALETGETTFKRYRRSPPRLQPFSTNPDHMSIPFTDDTYVLGRVRRVLIDL